MNYDQQTKRTKPQIALHSEKAHDSWPTVLAAVEGEMCQPGTEINTAEPVTSREKTSSQTPLLHSLDWRQPVILLHSHVDDVPTALNFSSLMEEISPK